MSCVVQSLQNKKYCQVQRSCCHLSDHYNTKMENNDGVNSEYEYIKTMSGTRFTNIDYLNQHLIYA